MSNGSNLTTASVLSGLFGRLLILNEITGHIMSGRPFIFAKTVWLSYFCWRSLLTCFLWPPYVVMGMPLSFRPKNATQWTFARYVGMWCNFRMQIRRALSLSPTFWWVKICKFCTTAIVQFSCKTFALIPCRFLTHTTWFLGYINIKVRPVISTIFMTVMYSLLEYPNCYLLMEHQVDTPQTPPLLLLGLYYDFPICKV